VNKAGFRITNVKAALWHALPALFMLCRVKKVPVPMFASLIIPWLALLIGVVELVMTFHELVLFIPKLAGAY